MQTIEDFMEDIRKKERNLEIFYHLLIFLFVLSVIMVGCEGNVSYESTVAEETAKVQVDEAINQVLEGYKTYEYDFEPILITNHSVARSELNRLYNDLEHFKNKSATLNYQAKFIHLQVLLLNARLTD